MTDEIFIKILNDTATQAEKNDFYRLLEEDSDQRESFYSFKNLHVLSAINQSRIQSASFEKFWSRVNPTKTVGIIGLWYRYAAIFVIALSLGILLHYLIPASKNTSILSRKIAYTSEKGSVSTIHLEDGSAIWLSSASKIVITKNLSGEITADLDGEAYFDLVPDLTRKLTVDLGYFKVKDIGTKFNIRAYGTEAGVYTTLVDGQIDLYGSGLKPMLSMKPGEYMQFNKQTGHVDLSQRDPTIATAWKDGKFVFIDKSLAEICRELENWYNVEIIIKNNTLADTRYTSVIKRTTTVNMVLKMLSLTDKINYQITDRKEARDIVTIF